MLIFSDFKSFSFWSAFQGLVSWAWQMLGPEPMAVSLSPRDDSQKIRDVKIRDLRFFITVKAVASDSIKTRERQSVSTSKVFKSLTVNTVSLLRRLHIWMVNTWCLVKFWKAMMRQVSSPLFCLIVQWLVDFVGFWMQVVKKMEAVPNLSSCTFWHLHVEAFRTPWGWTVLGWHCKEGRAAGHHSRLRVRPWQILDDLGWLVLRAWQSKKKL